MGIVVASIVLSGSYMPGTCLIIHSAASHNQKTNPTIGVHRNECPFIGCTVWQQLARYLIVKIEVC